MTTPICPDLVSAVRLVEEARRQIVQGDSMGADVLLRIALARLAEASVADPEEAGEAAGPRPGLLVIRGERS